MTYSSLNIQQKINAKNNAQVFWGDSTKRVYRQRDNDEWDCKMYSPTKLVLEPPLMNNRNYDGPGDNYYQQ